MQPPEIATRIYAEEITAMLDRRIKQCVDLPMDGQAESTNAILRCWDIAKELHQHELCAKNTACPKPQISRDAADRIWGIKDAMDSAPRAMRGEIHNKLREEVLKVMPLPKYE